MTEQNYPPPPPQPLGAIALTLQGNEMTSNMIVPKIKVNGYPVASKYGMNLIPMPPGRHSVYVSSQWLREFGQAQLEVDVAANQQTPVFYAVPYHQFTHGSIGFEKQKRRGAAVLWGIVIAITVIIGAAVALPFLLA